FAAGAAPDVTGEPASLGEKIRSQGVGVRHSELPPPHILGWLQEGTAWVGSLAPTACAGSRTKGSRLSWPSAWAAARQRGWPSPPSGAPPAWQYCGPSPFRRRVRPI